MKRKPRGTEEQPSRDKPRYTILLPMEIEIRRGFLKGKERVTARPVDLAIGGAACHVRSDPFFVVGARFRVFIDGTAGFAEVRNVQQLSDGLSRIGMSFVKLELETQERIVDAIDRMKFASSRINPNS